MRVEIYKYIMMRKFEMRPKDKRKRRFTTISKCLWDKQRNIRVNVKTNFSVLIKVGVSLTDSDFEVFKENPVQ